MKFTSFLDERQFIVHSNLRYAFTSM